MYRTVYFHKTSRAAEVMLKMLFRRVKDRIDSQGSLQDVSSPLIEAFTGQMFLTRFLDFDDHPFRPIRAPHPCGLCGATDSYLDEVVIDDCGGRLFVCSDTDHCAERRAAGHVGAEGFKEAAE